MPSNWLYMDTNFPAFTGQETVREQVTTIQNYMFMLVEQLRYSLHNLDGKNFNAAGLERIGETITEPIRAQLEDAEGTMTQLEITAGRMIVAMGDMEGNISAIQQKVDSLSLSVSNGTSSSMLYLTAGEAVLASASITFSGVVTFTDLSNTGGRTVINGGNITTGVISGMKMEANEIVGGTITGTTLRSVSGSDNGLEIYYSLLDPDLLVGGIRFDDQGEGTEAEARYRMFVYTSTSFGVGWAMKLQSAGSMSLQSGGMIYVRAATNVNISAPGGVFVEGWQFRDDGIYRDGKKIVSAA